MLHQGELVKVELREGAHAQATLRPVRGVDVGAGPGHPLERALRGGIVGLVLDGRGRRPLAVPTERAARVAAAQRASDALEVYPANK